MGVRWRNGKWPIIFTIRVINPINSPTLLAPIFLVSFKKVEKSVRKVEESVRKVEISVRKVEIIVEEY